MKDGAGPEDRTRNHPHARWTCIRPSYRARQHDNMIHWQLLRSQGYGLLWNLSVFSDNKKSKIIEALNEMSQHMWKGYLHCITQENSEGSGKRLCCSHTQYTVEQIRRVFDDNWRIIFIILHKNICCGYSLESPRRGDSNEHPQHIIFLWRNKQNYPLIITKYLFLFHWI